MTKATKRKVVPKETTETPPGRARALLDPFDVMRATRALAPYSSEHNDVRWLTGKSLRRVHVSSEDESLELMSRLRYEDVLRSVENRVGPAAWPILKRIVLEGASVRECRHLVPEIVTPWRADAVITDRLRVALDMLAPLLGVTGEAKP